VAKSIDVRGEICPYPMMKASEALKKLSLEEPLDVLTDHAPALTTIPWEAAKHGRRATIERVGQSEWKISLTAGPALAKEELMADLAKQLEAVGGHE
jgi:tRNA 2-thiouridine synthesizing protein A